MLRPCDESRRTYSAVYTRAQWTGTLCRRRPYIVMLMQASAHVGDGCKSRRLHRQMHWRRRCQMVNPNRNLPSPWSSPLLTRSDMSLSLFCFCFPTWVRLGKPGSFQPSPGSSYRESITPVRKEPPGTRDTPLVSASDFAGVDQRLVGSWDEVQGLAGILPCLAPKPRDKGCRGCI